MGLEKAFRYSLCNGEGDHDGEMVMFVEYTCGKYGITGTDIDTDRY